MIDGRTQLVGLIGWPVEHSLSPAMHNAVFAALELNWHYVPLPVPPRQVEAAVRGLAALGFRGANVTVPHKQAVMPVVDALAPNARQVGAVNTLVIERRADGSPIIHGHNTDDQGFVSALRQSGFRLEEGRRAVVVGAGGAARAVVFGLLVSGIGEVVVLNRTLERGECLVSELGRRSNSKASHLHALALTSDALIECAHQADLLVNATSLGMVPHAEQSIWPDGVPMPRHLTVVDLVCNPQETRLLQQARQSGACPLGGLEMLVQQGALAFELWTGLPAPLEVMRIACKQALRR